MKPSGAVLCCCCWLMIAIVAVNAQQVKRNEVRKYIRECCTHHNVLPREAIKVLKGNFENVVPAMKCVVMCLYQKTEFADEKGNLLAEKLKEKVREHLEQDKAEELIKKCTVKGKNKCDTAFELYKCYFNNHGIENDFL